jgi:hypothetical protein
MFAVHIFVKVIVCLCFAKMTRKKRFEKSESQQFYFFTWHVEVFRNVFPDGRNLYHKAAHKSKKKEKIFPSFCPFPNSPIWDSHDWDIRTLKKNPEKQNKFHWEIIHNHFTLSKILHFKVKNNVIEFIQPKVSKLLGIWFTNKNM